MQFSLLWWLLILENSWWSPVSHYSINWTVYFIAHRQKRVVMNLFKGNRNLWTLSKDLYDCPRVLNTRMLLHPYSLTLTHCKPGTYRSYVGIWSSCAILVLHSISWNLYHQLMFLFTLGWSWLWIENICRIFLINNMHMLICQYVCKVI